MLCAWARLEGEDGDIARARELMEQAVKKEPSNAVVWRVYETIETNYGDRIRADTVFRRSLQAAKMSDRRLVLSEPQPGDFAPTGSWIDEEDLRVDIEKQERRMRRTDDSSGLTRGDDAGSAGLRNKPQRSQSSVRAAQARSNILPNMDDTEYDEDTIVDFRAPRARLNLDLD